MKKLRAFIILGLMGLGFNLFAQNYPERDSFKVKDVSKAYDPKEWIVSTKEEPKGDHKLTKYPETDIKGIISCYDEDYLRFDILLHNPVTGKNPTFFCLTLEYSGSFVEYYFYRADTKEFIIFYEEDGEIIDSEIVTKENGHPDWALVTSSAGKANTDVAFIIKKDYHLQDKKGSVIFLTASFSTGIIEKQTENIITSDYTDPVNVYFEM